MIDDATRKKEHIGVLLARAQSVDPAVRLNYLDDAYRIEPQGFETNYALGAHKLSTGDYEPALQHLDTAFRATNTERRALIEPGLVVAVQGLVSQKESQGGREYGQYYQQLLKYFPDSPFLNAWRGRELFIAGQFKEAMPHFEEASGIFGLKNGLFPEVDQHRVSLTLCLSYYKNSKWDLIPVLHREYLKNNDSQKKTILVETVLTAAAALSKYETAPPEQEKKSVDSGVAALFQKTGYRPIARAAIKDDNLNDPFWKQINTVLQELKTDLDRYIPWTMKVKARVWM